MTLWLNGYTFFPQISNFSLDTFSECDRIEKVRDFEGASAFAEQSIISLQREDG